MAKVYRPISVPQGVKVELNLPVVVVTGKLGKLSLTVPPGVTVKLVDNQVVVEGETGVPRAYIGTTLAHIRNMFVGVTDGYKKVVELRGMGYRVQKTKIGVQFNCGFSHPVDVVAPAGITMEINQVPNPDDPKEQMFEITVSGVDKQVVGDVAARIRAIKPADPYHGKGFRYRGELVRKKAGKRAVAAQG